MNNFIVRIFLLFVCSVELAACHAERIPEWKKIYTKQEVRDKFVDPPMFYAPHAFWFWDDTIRNDNRAACMVKNMVEQHLNPGYAHARSGFAPGVASLPIEQYLAEPWFNSFDNALMEAKKYGMTLGYCDDYNWPSGQAAGRILQQYPELKALSLLPQRYCVKGGDKVEYSSVDFAVAAKKVNKEKIDASTLRIIGENGVIKWNVPTGDWVIYTYKIIHHPGIDGGRVNYLDPKLMKVFIPMVHEMYELHFKNEMGKGIPGVFVDNEGDYGWKFAWSEYFAEKYKKKKGRDIRLWLPLLTEEDKDGLFVTARCDWFDVVSDVYNECYFIPLVNWLKEHDMYYISNLWEESLQLQSAGVGDFMRTTRCVTMPGNDCLDMVSQDVHDFKEVQTVSEFENRPFMSEIMGVAGWVQTPEMMKMTVNSIISYGVSHIVPHGIYMNRNLESVPYPADWYVDNPYWNYLRYWTDFSRRASFVTRQSEAVADVLLINPIESVWAFSKEYFLDSKGLNASWGDKVDYINNIYSEAMRRMNKGNIDFLIGDKYYLNKGKTLLTNSGTKFVINNHMFNAIIIPPTYIMSYSSLKAVYNFARKGGVVVVLGELPVGSPNKGLLDKQIIELSEKLITLPHVVSLANKKDKMDLLVSTLYNKLDLQIRLEDAGRLYTAQRRLGDANLYWFANNTDTVKHFVARLRDAVGDAEIWDCETGEKRFIASESEKGYRKILLTLHPYEAFWLVFDPEYRVNKQFTNSDKSFSERRLIADWNISYPEESCIYKTTAKVLYTNEEIPDIKKMSPDYDDSSWKYYSHQEDDKDNYLIAYRRMNVPIGTEKIIFPFNMRGKKVWLDGKEILVSDTLLDVTAPKLLSYIVECNRQDRSIMPFKFYVTSNKISTDLQSWYSWGLQQYSGYLDYETSLYVENKYSEMLIELGNVKYMAEVYVNGKSVGARLWPPFRFEISDYLKRGENSIKVRIGNLISNELWIKDDMRKLREWNWAWKEDPDLSQYSAGFWGPVKLFYR